LEHLGNGQCQRKGPNGATPEKGKRKKRKAQEAAMEPTDTKGGWNVGLTQENKAKSLLERSSTRLHRGGGKGKNQKNKVDITTKKDEIHVPT